MTPLPLLLLVAVAARPLSAMRARGAEREVSPGYPPTEQQLQRLTPRCREQLQGLKDDLVGFCLQQFPQGVACNLMVGMVFAGESNTFAVENLTSSDKDSMLWAGMWDGGEPGRTSKKALLHFANLVDASTVHPSTKLGEMVEKHGDLQACNNDLAAQVSFTGERRDEGLVPNFWKMASERFVKDMKLGIPVGSVVVIVNKDLDPSAERSFYKSVLYNYELPTIATTVNLNSFYASFDPWHVRTFAPGRNHWLPQMLVVDLRDTCEEMVESIKGKLLMACETTCDVQEWLKKKPLRCLPCAAGCKLDQSFAKKVKKELNRKWYHIF